MLARDVLKSVRFIISDTATQRWTDARLLALLNDGLNDIAKTTILFTDTMFVELINNQSSYDLSELATKIIRVEFEDKVLTQSSFNEMDKKYPCWQQAEGEKLKAYILNKQREANIIVYPKPVNATLSNINFGSSYGIVTGITYSELELNIGQTLGDIGAVEQDGFIKVFYVRRPVKVTSLTDELFVNDLVLEPLTHYIAGRALRDNQDTQNRILGNEELTLYKQQLDEYSMEKAKNFSQATFNVPYRPTGV